MAWTTPKTDWSTGELVTAEDMNAVGENLAALSFTRLIQNLGAGSHSFKLQWKSRGAARVFRRAQFWVREI